MPYGKSGSKRVLFSAPKFVSAKKVAKGKSLVRQVKALINSKKRDAADVSRALNATAAQATTSYCLTTTGLPLSPGVAASGTGLLDMDGDECLINSIHFRSQFSQPVAVDATQTGNVDSLVRKLLVWYNKPLLVASAAGTLPPVTEVLISDALASLKVTSNANGGRFQVLSDKLFRFGQNTIVADGATAAPHLIGPSSNQIHDYTVKVNKNVKFAVSSVSGTPAGHYDSDVGPGRIDKGLLVMYTLYSNTQAINETCATRLNYTG